MDARDTDRQIGVVLWRVVRGRARVKTVRGVEKWASSRRLVGLNISGIAACRYIGPPYCGQSIIPIRRSNNNPRYKEESSLPLNLGTIDSFARLSKHGNGKSELTKVLSVGPVNRTRVFWRFTPQLWLYKLQELFKLNLFGIVPT